MKSLSNKFRLSIWLVFFLFSLLCQGQNANALEIPNGDGDVLWERSLKIDGKWRNVNNAIFHPVNGNILLAMDTEIWEIDPKDGHTIRVFDVPPKISHGFVLNDLDISPDGTIIITEGLQYNSGMLFWDYNSGKIVDSIPYYSWNGRFYPDNQTMLFFARPTPGGLKSGFVKYNYRTKEIIQEKSISDNLIFQGAELSKDGKKLAIGVFHSEPNSFSMELWDAETLTKIIDFGETDPSVANFEEIKISNNGEYVGFVTSGNGVNLLLFNTITSAQIKKMENFNGFSFSNDNKKLFYCSRTNKLTDLELNVLTLPKLDTVYQYLKCLGGGVFNTNNEMFTTGLITWQTGITMKFLSNKWYETDVNESKERQTELIYPNPASEYIEVNAVANGHLPLPEDAVQQEIRIFDVFGKCALNVRAIHKLPLRIDVSTLPEGVYFLRAGSEVHKFMIVR